jgi:OmpR-family two-component system manganese-sensing response regulator
MSPVPTPVTIAFPVVQCDANVVQGMQILLVDDEVELTEPLSRILRREGYTVDIAHSGIEGSHLAAQGKYDLLILDWMLPQSTGLEICQQLRSQGDKTPVLFLTAKDTVDDRVEGLDAGADDYLVKPFELRELLARVRALLRRPPTLESPTTPRLRVDDLELDPENQLAYRRGRLIELSEKESQLLAYLMRHPNQVLTHEQIHQHLWREDDKPSSNVLAAQIRLLRRKIEANQEPPLVHTVYGKGYRFGVAVDADAETTHPETE